MEPKRRIRQIIRQRLETADRFAESVRIVQRLEKLLPDDGGVLAYEPLKDEPDIDILLDRLRGEDRLALVVGAHDSPDIHPADIPIVLALVPGRAFDRRGHRLGRGGGTFDRLLARIDCRRIGVAFDCQIFDRLPTGEHDIPMHEIVTATEHLVFP